MATCDELAPFVLPEVEGLESGTKKGGGSYGSIYDVTVNSTPYIAKRLHDILVDYNYVIPRDREAALEMFRQECILLSKLEHPNIVRFIGVHYGRNPDDLSLIMEKLHTDLDKYLETHPNIPLSVKLSILYDVSCGLLYLHEHSPPIIHRDLTARNILLTHDMRAKIADLGVSKIFDLRAQVATTQTKAPGMVCYMPPEALTDKPQYDVSLDIFSFGHLTLHTVTQTFPQTDDNKITESAVRRGERQLAKREATINQIGRDHCLYPLIAKCLQDMPKRRPTTRELNGMIEAIISLMSVNILVLGRTGVGKSALINSLAGCNATEEIATECESWKPETADVQSHDVESKGINMTLWDTPGYLEDGFEKGDAEQTLCKVEAKCNPTKADLVLFCVNFSNKRIAKEDVTTVTAYTEKFGVEMWDHAVIAFANANEVQPPPDSPEASSVFFKRKLDNWTEGFRKILQTKAKVPEEKLGTIPMIPTGYRECSLPDREDWITMLWASSYNQVKLSAQPAFSKIYRMCDRLALKEDATESQIVEKRHLDFSKATHSSRCSLQ